MLWGPPGVGKSRIIAQIAGRHGVPLIDIRLSQMESADLCDVPFRNGDLVEWSVPALLPQEIGGGGGTSSCRCSSGSRSSICVLICCCISPMAKGIFRRWRQIIRWYGW